MLHMTACLLSLLLVHSIPLDNLRSSTTHEFLHRFVRMADGSPFNISTKTYPLATPYLCEPHFETISLPKDRDPKIIIYPPCTRIERCSGCSSADLLVCEPIETEMVSLTVLKFILPQQESAEYLLNGTEEVLVERHLKCHQLCRVKATDCNQDIHTYLQSDCRCVCKVRVRHQNTFGRKASACVNVYRQNNAEGLLVSMNQHASVIWIWRPVRMAKEKINHLEIMIGTETYKETWRNTNTKYFKLMDRNKNV